MKNAKSALLGIIAMGLTLNLYATRTTGVFGPANCTVKDDGTCRNDNTNCSGTVTSYTNARDNDNGTTTVTNGKCHSDSSGQHDQSCDCY
jgi:hypothetical protein